MSTLYELYALPQGRRCIRVLEVLPAISRLSESEMHRRDVSNPILQINRPGNAIDNPPHAPLRFRLKVVDLDHSPEFTALSYVWGLPTADQPVIRYNDTTIDVTENCYTALVHLRKAVGGFTIWVDAICINQSRENNTEKEAQLLLMGEIYSRAKSVYIWLGESTPGTDRAMRYLDRGGLSKYCRLNNKGRLVTSPWAASWALLIGSWTRDKHPVLYKTRRSGKNASAADIEELLSQRWIERLWTYQEILLAENPIVVCGEYHVTWSNFERGIMPLLSTYFLPEVSSAHAWRSVCHSREQLRKQDKNAERTRPTLKRYEAFLRRMSIQHRIVELAFFMVCLLSAGLTMMTVFYHSALGKAGKGEIFARVLLFIAGACALIFVLTLPPVLVLVLSGRILTTDKKMWDRMPVEDLTSSLYVRNASEPKDMAFGVWAVLQKKAADDPLPKLTYANGIGYIYWTLATQLMQRTKSVQLLYLAAAKGMPGAPSWVPDWAGRQGHQWRTVMSSMPQTDLHGRHLEISSHNFRFQQRDQDTSGYFELDATGRILSVRGRRVCDVRELFHLEYQETGQVFQESEVDVHVKNLGLMLRCASLWRRIKALEGDFHSRFPFELLSRAGKLRQDAWFKEHAAEISTWSRFCRRHSRKAPSAVLALLREEGSTNKNILATQMMLSNLLATEGRPLFKSRRIGLRWLHGICGRNVQIGDQIVRVEGLPQLLVLREISGEGEDGQADGSKGQAVKIISPAGLFKGNNPPKQSGEASTYHIH